MKVDLIMINIFLEAWLWLTNLGISLIQLKDNTSVLFHVLMMILSLIAQIIYIIAKKSCFHLIGTNSPIFSFIS